MAENHTSNEDSGQHSGSKISSVVLSKHENSPESTSKPVANQYSSKNQQQQDYRTRGSTVDHKLFNKFKPTQRRNTIQNAQGIPSTSNLRKPSLPKMNSLINNEDTGDSNAISSGCVSNESTSKHYPQNNASANNAVARTTSESLRLNAMPTIANDTHSLSNTISNSSLSRLSCTSNSGSSSTRPASNSYESQSSFSPKIISQNNNMYSTDDNTSNSERIHHSHNYSHNKAAVVTSLARKPKNTSSFQITSVTVGQGKKSSDNGEESADDLDESHTDETSRTMDLENDLPSISEDTFSKDEVFYANSALSNTAPAIPTSSEYGLVVVDTIEPNLDQHIQNVQVNVAENIINLVSATVTPGGSKKKEDIKDTQHRSERFKVVKIESTEPFRRGRWMCMDYLDHSTVGNGGKEGNNNEKNGTMEANVGNGEHSKTTQSMIIGTGASALLENNTDSMNNAHIADSNWNFSSNMTNMGVEGTSPSQQQLNQHLIGPSGIATAPATMAAGMPDAQAFLNSIEQEQLQRQQQSNTNFDTHSTFDSQNPTYNDALNQNESTNGTEPSADFATVAAQQLKKSLQQLKQQEDAIAAAEAAAAHIFVPGESQQQQMNFAHLQQHQQLPTQNATNEGTGVTNNSTTIPTMLNFQNGNTVCAESNQTSPSNQTESQLVNEQSQSQSQSQLQQNQNSHLEQAQLTNHQMTYAEVAQQNAQQHLHPQNQINVNSQPTGVTYISQQSTVPKHSTYEDINSQHQQQQQQQSHVTSTVPSNIVIPQNLQQQLSQTDGNQTNSILQHSQPTQFQQTLQAQTIPMMAQVSSFDIQSQQQQHPATMQQSAPATLADGNALIASLQAVQRQHQVTGLENLMGQMALGTAGASLRKSNATTSTNTGDDLSQQQQQILQTNTESETESASGTSAVAIDNKIEQAMDLVKSHLMIAVREEVEVLKERISELVDKINQLEVENTILKANMSQETLQQLQLQAQLQLAGSTNTSAIQASSGASNGNNQNTAATPTTNGNTTADTGVLNTASTPTIAAAENVGITAANMIEADSTLS